MAERSVMAERVRTQCDGQVVFGVVISGRFEIAMLDRIARDFLVGHRD